MPGDELAAELLTRSSTPTPWPGRCTACPGYDALSARLRPRVRVRPRTGARVRSPPAPKQTPEAGLEETELQTLDFVRCMARGMADAATVPVIEFTISDTFAAPVGDVFSSLPKIPLDTEERREGYLTRLRGLSDCSTPRRGAIRRRTARAVPRWPGSSRPPSPNST